ncbi:hypothetical protein MRX96_032188 [Rhipicephalus microplus]
MEKVRARKGALITELSPVRPCAKMCSSREGHCYVPLLCTAASLHVANQSCATWRVEAAGGGAAHRQPQGSRGEDHRRRRRSLGVRVSGRRYTRYKCAASAAGFP